MPFTNPQQKRNRDAWWKMHQRCFNAKDHAYHRYGGRGITVCERWRKFENFLEDMGEVPVGMSLDRIDNNGNYEPGNCRWATSSQQNRNKRNSHLVTAFGETKTLAAWLEDPRCALTTSAGIRKRLRDGWRPEAAIAQSPYINWNRGVA